MDERDTDQFIMTTDTSSRCKPSSFCVVLMLRWFCIYSELFACIQSVLHRYTSLLCLLFFVNSLFGVYCAEIFAYIHTRYLMLKVSHDRHTVGTEQTSSFRFEDAILLKSLVISSVSGFVFVVVCGGVFHNDVVSNFVFIIHLLIIYISIF